MSKRGLNIESVFFRRDLLDYAKPLLKMLCHSRIYNCDRLKFKFCAILIKIGTLQTFIARRGYVTSTCEIKIRIIFMSLGKK